MASATGHPLALLRAASDPSPIEPAAPLTPAAELAANLTAQDEPDLPPAEVGAVVPLAGHTLASTPVGTVSHVPADDARNQFHAGLAPRHLSEPAAARMQAAATERAAATFGPDATAVQVTPAAADGHRTVLVRCGPATIRVRCVEDGRWPARNVLTRLEPPVLVGTATRVDSPAFAAGAATLDEVITAAVTARGRHGDDVDAQPLPPHLARKFVRPVPTGR